MIFYMYIQRGEKIMWTELKFISQHFGNYINKINDMFALTQKSIFYNGNLLYTYNIFLKYYL